MQVGHESDTEAIKSGRYIGVGKLISSHPADATISGAFFRRANLGVDNPNAILCRYLRRQGGSQTPVRLAGREKQSRNEA